MSPLLHNTILAWQPVAIGAAFLVIGFAAGLLHFGLLWRTAQAVASGDVAASLVHTAIRFIVTGCALFLASRWGAAALVAAALGLMAARFVILRANGGLAR